MKPWSEVEADPAFQALSPTEKYEAQEQYFNEVVAPNIPQEEWEPVKGEFFGQFGRALPIQDTGQSKIAALGSDFMRNLGGVVPSTIKGIGELSEMGVRNLNPVAWAAMAGVPGAQSVVDFYAKPGEFLSGTVAEGMENKLEEATPINPLYQDDFSQKAVGAVGQGTGQLASMLLPAKALSLTPKVARALGIGQAFAMGASQGAETAETYGVTDPLQKMLMTYGGGAIEAGTESFGGVLGKGPTEALLGALKSAARPGTAATRALKTVGSEFGEEMVAGEGRDLLTKAIVQEDPNRPGFALNGAALPPDTLSMQNLYNRLEEGALGAIGGTVFAGAEYLGSRTKTDEALALRMQAQNVINNLRSKETLTPEEQDQLAQMEVEDQNVGAWLERQGMDKVRPALDAMMDNPELSDSERSEAISYAALIDNLSAVENAPEATPEEIQGAREAVSNHPLNRVNPLDRKRQQTALAGTYAEKVKRLKEDIAATKKPTIEQAAIQEAQQEAIATGAPETAAALAQLTEEEPSIPISPEVAAVAPQTAAVLQQIVSEPTTPQTDAIQEQITAQGVLRQERPELGLQEMGGSYPQGQEAPTKGLQEEVNVQPLPQEPVPQQPAQPALEAVQETLQPAPTGPVQAGSTGAQTGVAVPTASPSPTKPQLRRPRVQLGIAVSPREIQRAVRKFSRIAPMRIASSQELAQDPTLRSVFSSEETWQDFVENQLPYAEGLSNDGTGSAVIIPENLAIYNTDQERAQRNGTTAGEEAMIRVMLHENWHGIERWLEHSGDPAADTLKERYYSILNEISEQELDDLAKRRYHHLSNWREDSLSKRILQSEVLAERREMAELTGEPDSLIEKFFAWLRDVFKTVTGSQSDPTPDELQELFNAWYRAQKSTQTRAGPVQESMTEIPPRPEVLVSYEDRGTGNTLDEILDSMWRPFYSAWESRQLEAGQPLDQKQLAKDWQNHISDPDFLFDKDVELRIQKKNANRNWIDFTPEPSQTTPETGKRRNAAKTPTPTSEDIASRFPQFSLPELTPEQQQARLAEITDRLSYTPSTEQQEGQSPAQATKDQRKYATDGAPVEMYRTGVSGAELDELSKEALGIAISNSLDGPSETFGTDLMKYMRGEIPTLYGMPDNAFLKTAIAINLEHDPLQRNRLGIDGGDLRKIIQQNLSLAGRTLRSAAHGRLYQALKEMTEKGDKLVDDNAESSIGTKDFKSLADGVNKEVVQAILPLADEVVTEDIVSILADSAQMQADTADFSAAIESLPPKERKAVRDLLNELEELDELLRMEAEMSAGQAGPAASRAEVRAQKMTLAEVQAKIAQKRQTITRLVEEIEKAKVQGDPVEAAKKVVKRVRKPKEAPPTENERLRQWAAGKLEVEGLGKPAKTIQKYIQAGGLNTNSLTTVLTTAFPEANPVFVVGLVNRMADLIDGRATKDGILDDIKKGGGKPDPKLVEKMVRIAEQARKGRERAIQSMEKKLAKVKNPTPQKMKQRSKFVNLLQEGMNSGILDSDVVRAAFAQAYDLHGMTPERLKEMADLMNEIDSLPDGMVKETFHLRWMQILNDIAPSSSISGMAFSAYMGYVLQGAGTMIAQTSNLANFLTPLAFAHSFGQIYATTQGTPLKKLFTALSLRRNWNIAVDGMKEARQNLALIQAGVSGIKTSTGQGLGVTPVELIQTPYETSLAWTPWGQISQFRLKPHKLMDQMGVGKLFRATRLPAWVASRSFQVIRGAEGWSGGVEKNMAFRKIAVMELQKQGKSYDEAYQMVEDALNPKTNAQMWEEAYREADKNIADGTVNKAARKQRATELVQDMLDKKWDLILANRHRQQSAVANFKTDPITPLGAGAYHLVSMALKHQHWGPIPNPLRFGFLFPRFFINSMEQAYMYSPAGLLGATGIRTNLADSEMKERQQRIVQIYGSLENYKNQRIGKGLTGTALLTGIGAMMTAAMQMWDPDDDEPPMFWMTGDVIGRYDRRGILSETGWWAPNTMYIMGMKFNYVNASPQFGMILNAAGNIGDRFMFPELLGTKYNARTKEYEESFAEQWIRPVGESIAAPMSRSTYRTFYDALDNAMGGDFKKLTRLATQPLSGTTTALTLGVIPSLKTFEKLEKSNIQPRSPQDISQTLQAGVPFANAMGLDTGKPLYSPFGEELTPYNFFTFLSNSQEATEDSKKAAKILLDLGVSKQPPKLEYLGDGVVEVAHEGKYYLLPPEQRNRIIMQMGKDLAKSIIREKSKLQKLEKEKGRDAVSDRVGTLASEARKRALARFKPEK